MSSKAVEKNGAGQAPDKKTASAGKKKVRLIKVRVKTGLMFNGVRYTTGDVIEDMPEAAAEALLERHFIEKVE